MSGAINTPMTAPSGWTGYLAVKKAASYLELLVVSFCIVAASLLSPLALVLPCQCPAKALMLISRVADAGLVSLGEPHCKMLDVDPATNAGPISCFGQATAKN